MSDEYHINAKQVIGLGSNPNIHDFEIRSESGSKIYLNGLSDKVSSIRSKFESKNDFNKLVEELSKLRLDIEKKSNDSQMDNLVNNVARIEIEAKNHNHSKVLKCFQKTVEEIWDISKKVGTTLATEALKETIK